MPFEKAANEFMFRRMDIFSEFIIAAAMPGIETVIRINTDRFHSRGRPKVWRTQIKPGINLFDEDGQMCYILLAYIN